eukprot:GHVT01047868.1.p1 GENE.GHVT01047868.1~~GHVT01047868.1.p1  ORF type:complete len:151 (-),score=10.66 GHVT01047868.1:62-514(-)
MSQLGEVRGVILQSPLTSIHRIAVNTRFTFPWDMFANIDKIENVGCPVFIFHGMKDALVPVSHGMELYNRCRTAVEPMWVENAGHNDLESNAFAEVLTSISRFLRFLERSEDEYCLYPDPNPGAGAPLNSPPKDKHIKEKVDDAAFCSEH